jgi:hypothetical protein
MRQSAMGAVRGSTAVCIVGVESTPVAGSVGLAVGFGGLGRVSVVTRTVATKCSLIWMR